MRDRKRIETFLNEFKTIWEQYPDLRFGQLVYCILLQNKIDLFQIEDDKFLNLMKEFKLQYIDCSKKK